MYSLSHNRLPKLLRNKEKSIEKRKLSFSDSKTRKKRPKTTTVLYSPYRTVRYYYYRIDCTLKTALENDFNRSTSSAKRLKKESDTEKRL